MRVTPMLRQFFDAKEQHPDALMLFRMGDFYELFFDDAKTASELLDIALTSRNKGGGEDAIPMAGVPHHSVASYIQRLVDAGHKVAICEQVTEPTKGKQLVDREVVRVITPGVCVDVDEARADQSNYLASVAPVGKHESAWSIALADVSTGELRVTEVDSAVSLAHELARAGVREVVVPEGRDADVARDTAHLALHRRVVPRSSYSLSGLGRRLRDLASTYRDRDFRSAVMAPAEVEAYVERLDVLGLRHPKAGRSALSALLWYIAEAQMGVPANLAPPMVDRPQDYVALDQATEANLEIFEALIGGGRANSLIAIVDQTVTSAGRRLLRRVLAYPLVDVARIRARHEVVEALMASEGRRARVRERLREVSDIHRLTGRVVGGGANARDLVALAQSLSQVPALLAQRDEADPPLLVELFERLDPCTDLVAHLDRALVEDPPTSISDGGLFRAGYHADLDELIVLSRSGKDWLLEYEGKERKASGIDSLKLKYNKVFGYYLEVTKANLHKVPDDYIRKQTLTSAERYFTLELKEYEDKILNAQERRAKLEQALFEGLVAEVIAHSGRLYRSAQQLAWIDVLAALAELGARFQYVRPTMDEGLITEIQEGRHPVVERTAAGERFIPNSVRLDADNEQLLIVTGPNMAGKSTIIRQVALIQLLGQIGSFVPAKAATLGVVDQIFSRVGASDNLAQGQSTFMVEMTQTAHILRHATSRSLIVLDEIGRGTSTFDGLSIAWAVAEHLCDHTGARAMFATHYHELTELARTRDRVRNVSVAVKEWNDDIVFLRRLVDGPANQSYGIQVGRLAGLPEAVVNRAKQVLNNLESVAYTNGGVPTLAVDPAHPTPPSGQLDLFGVTSIPPELQKLQAAVESIDPDALSPRDALELVYRLAAILNAGS